MFPEKNGVKFVEYAEFGPYKIWDSDKWKCPKCGLEILVGFGNGPLKEHWQTDFISSLEKFEASGDVIHEIR